MDLLRRSFFQETEEHKSFPQFYKMHDLIHDLAKEVADGEVFSITETEDAEIVLPEQTLYASCLFQVDDSLEFPNSKHMKLRTFIYLDLSEYVISNSTLERMVSSFEYLRVLDLHHVGIKVLPQSLGGLKHLRYLAVSSYNIVTLPNFITKLHNLQVLKLVNCINLKKLPRDIWRLVSLRRLVCRYCSSLTHIPPGLWQLSSVTHLDFDGCCSLEDMPPGIGQLTSLRTLTSFVVGSLASDKLNELKGLADLRNRLQIKFMGQARAIGERIPTDVVKRMKHLQELSVKFKYGNQEDDTGADLIMLEALQTHQNIERLQIKNYSGPRFPSWLMVDNLGFLLPKLVYLDITNCCNCQKLPPLWRLPSLQHLDLSNLDVVESIEGDDECYFPSLKRLYLGEISEKTLKQILCPPRHPSPLCNSNSLSLSSIEGVETMPEDSFKCLTSLQSLFIINCRNLVSLSTCLTHLTSLEILYIVHCPLLDLSNEEAMQFEVPGNLSTFVILDLDKLMSLPVWLQHFSGTLKSIEIWGCPNFTTIPEWIGDLIALNRLEIHDSPMLTSFPEGMRSLTALQELIVQGCSSSLKQRCEKEVGEDWPKIAHIPRVDIREAF